MDRVPGLRHHDARTRFAELAGWTAPAAGGPTSEQLSAVQKLIDRRALLTICRELGYEREQIAAVYLGRRGVRKPLKLRLGAASGKLGSGPNTVQIEDIR
jgi:hypothetical protein